MDESSKEVEVSIEEILEGKDEATLSSMCMRSSIAFLRAGKPEAGGSFALAAATFAQAAQLKRISEALYSQNTVSSQPPRYANGGDPLSSFKLPPPYDPSDPNGGMVSGVPQDQEDLIEETKKLLGLR